MPKSIKNMLFLSITLFCVNSFSQTKCQAPIFSPNLDVQILNAELQTDYGLSSAQLKTLSTKHKNNDSNSPKTNLLGLYQNAKTYKMRPIYIHQRNLKTGTYCAALEKIVLQVVNNPKIYISKEAQMFSCTKHRTEQHELLHYKFDFSAIDELKPFLLTRLNKFFSKHLHFRTEQEMRDFFDTLVQNSLVLSNEFMNQKTNHLHEQIDNEENYIKESSYCSYEENVKLTKALRGEY